MNRKRKNLYRLTPCRCEHVDKFKKTTFSIFFLSANMRDEGGLLNGKHTHLNTSTTHTPPMKLTTINEMMMKKQATEKVKANIIETN